MSSKAIVDAPSAPKPLPGREVSPSVMRDDDPGISRYVGLAGAFLVIFGGIFLVANLWFNKGVIGPGWATFLLSLGVVGLLYHAAFDRDVQFRRVYMAFSYAALVVGAGLCLWPFHSKIGDQFAPGYLCLGLGLVFLLAHLRNEDDRIFRAIAQGVLLVGGVVLLAVGLIGGNVNTDFLLGYGLLCSILGLVFFSAFLSSRSSGDAFSFVADLTLRQVGASDSTRQLLVSYEEYLIGLSLGILGVIVFLLALVRSVFYPGETGSYLVPNGLVLMTFGAVAGMLSLGYCSESRIVVLTRRELGSFFYSPLAYFVLFGFTVAAMVNFFLWVVQMFNAGRPIPEPILQGFVYSFLPVMVTIVAVPVLTMRLFSEEWRTGTLEVMLTAPVGETTVVLSKFFAALFMFFLVWLPFALFLVTLRVMGGKPFDYRPAFAFAVVLLFTGASFTSLGVLCSSLTRNQLVSGVLAFTGMAVMTCIMFARWVIRSKGIMAVIDHVSYLELWQHALNGKLVPPGLFFHASLTVLFLFITVKVLEARKWL